MSAVTHRVTRRGWQPPSLKPKPQAVPAAAAAPAEAAEADTAASGTLGFAIFLILNAVLFIRPGELIPELLTVPIYQILMIVCLAVSLPAIFQRFASHSLLAEPITLCVFGLLVAVVLAQLSHFRPGTAYDDGYEF